MMRTKLLLALLAGLGCCWSGTAGGVSQPMPMPPPPLPFQPFADADYEQCLRDQGYAVMNGSCSGPADCVPGLVCGRAGVCQCAPGFKGTSVGLGGQTGAICLPVPRFHGQKCTDDCEAPLECVQGRCRCSTGYKLRSTPRGINSQGPSPPPSCYKECEEDEIRTTNQITGARTCRKRCQPNELLVDGECMSESGLNEPCSNSRMCVVAFSKCANKVCSCTDGFAPSADSTGCTPTAISCPHGPTLVEGGGPVGCTVTYTKNDDSWPNSGTGNSGGGSRFKISTSDTCPRGYYCQLNVPSIHGRQKAYTGHCCQKANHRCPVGRAHPTAACRPPGTEEGGRVSCPIETHYCYWSDNSGVPTEPLCCPRACEVDQLFKDGRCYAHALLGEHCRFDEQCERHVGVCDNGVCKCPPNAKLLEGGLMSSVCMVQCGAREIQVGTRCVKRKALDDSCGTDDAALCPLSSHCRLGKCRCHCTFKAMGKHLCASKPTCSSGGGVGPPFPGAPFQRRIVANPIYCSIQTLERSNSNEAKELYTDVKAVDKCPTEFYCSMYQPAFALGVCCPKPEAQCPDGSRPTRLVSCDPANPRLSCEAEQICHRYYSPADTTTADGFICCPNTTPPVFNRLILV